MDLPAGGPLKPAANARRASVGRGVWVALAGLGLLASFAGGSTTRERPDIKASPTRAASAQAPAAAEAPPPVRPADDLAAMLGALDPARLHARPKAAAAATDPFFEPPPPAPPQPAPDAAPKRAAVTPVRASPAPAPAPAPTAPALPFRYLGRLIEGAQPPRVLLARGDEAIVARAGDTIAGDYRLDEVSANELVFVYLPLDQRQSMVLR